PYPDGPLATTQLSLWLFLIFFYYNIILNGYHVTSYSVWIKLFIQFVKWLEPDIFTDLTCLSVVVSFVFVIFLFLLQAREHLENIIDFS
ncbi:hypothetical protein ACJX0J_038329, partial [Zea mays]